MRDRFDNKRTLFLHDIESAQIPEKSRDSIVGLMASLLKLYSDRKYRSAVLTVLEDSIGKKKPTGPKGLNLWQIFVLAQYRLCSNATYDRLHYMVNHDMLLRHILGIRAHGDTQGITWQYQRIYDNVALLDDEALQKINTIIVEFGHGVFKKKGTAALRLKTDSYAVQSNVHFPTDYNLPWDSARKSLDMVAKFLRKYGKIESWRKINDRYTKLKSLSRALGKASSSGGKNKGERIKQAAAKYLGKARSLYDKLQSGQKKLPVKDLADAALLCNLDRFMALLLKHIDLVDRRLLKGEKIPHGDKLFSIFEQYTEWISKGKKRPSVELGKKLSVTTDQYNLIIDYEVMESTSDSQTVVPLADRLRSKHSIDIWSFDKGYWHTDNKAHLQKYVRQVIMPKKGKCNQVEKEGQSQRAFKKYRNKHSAIESNINELEHRGLDRCPDRNYKHFKRYIGLGVISYNLHKIGKEILRQSKTAKKQQQKIKHKAA